MEEAKAVKSLSGRIRDQAQQELEDVLEKLFQPAVNWIRHECAYAESWPKVKVGGKSYDCISALRLVRQSLVAYATPRREEQALVEFLEKVSGLSGDVDSLKVSRADHFEKISKAESAIASVDRRIVNALCLKEK